MKITDMKIAKLEPEIWPLHYVNIDEDMSVYLVSCRVDGKLYYQLFHITEEFENDADIDLDNYLIYTMTDVMKRKYGNEGDK